MRRFLVVTAATAMVVVHARPATVAAQTVVQTPRGPLELIGLHRWTYAMLQDSLARYAPGESLQSHQCQAILQGRLHFPSASAARYVMSSPTDTGAPAMHFVVTVVEPADSARVRRRVVTARPIAFRPAWRDVRRSIADDSTALDIDALPWLVQHYGVARRFGTDSALVRAARGDSSEAARASALWRALAARAQPADEALALRTLTSDGNAENRMVAAAILVNFPGSDAAWRGIAGALRDEDERVQSTASGALFTLTRNFARPVDWRPAATDLRSLIAGTNVIVLPGLLDALTATSVSPALAPALLAGNDALVLSSARAEFDRARMPAWRFLGRMSRRPDAGADAWAAWTHALPSPPGSARGASGGGA